MDLETENRIAAILLKEAAELRQQAQAEGALAYLRRPAARNRPNSRFLTATVRGVQQANRVVEVNEMWRLREKQLELDDRLTGKKDKSISRKSYRESVCGSPRSSNRSCYESEQIASSSHVYINQNILPTEGEGLRDDEVEEFLHARTKRGRGAVGSRMDETGPYPSCSDSNKILSGSSNDKLKKQRVLLGPEKPMSLKYRELSDDESLRNRKREAKDVCSSKRHSRKHKSRESKDKKKKKNRHKEEKKRQLYR